MIRRAFLRMAFAALASGLLGSELYSRASQLPVPIPEWGRFWVRATLDSDCGQSVGFFSLDGESWIRTDDVSLDRDGGGMSLKLNRRHVVGPYYPRLTGDLEIRADIEKGDWDD